MSTFREWDAPDRFWNLEVCWCLVFGVWRFSEAWLLVLGISLPMTLDDIMSIFWRLLAVIVLVGLNGFFVAAEFAIVKIRETQLQPLVARNSRRARMAARIVKNLDAALSATQLGITLASLGLGWIGEPVFAALLEPVMQWLQIESLEARHSISFAVGFSIITFLHIVLGELAPKSMAIQKPLPTTLWVAYPLHWFYKLSFPFIWTLNKTSLFLLRQVGIEPASEAELAHSEEELRLLLAGQKKDVGTTAGRDIVLNAFDLRHRIAREVMRPRQQIVGFDTEAPIQQCLEIAEHTRFSRFPLLERGSVDRALGFVHVKDLHAVRHKAQFGRDLLPLAKKLIYVPETSRLERLLAIFLERKVHMAFVVDEYGGTVGLVTLENILEELVGEIQDEFDQETPLLVRKDQNTWSIDGTLPLHDLSDVLGESIGEEGVTTASGWITHKLGGFPKAGDVLRVGTFELRVEQMDGARVARLSARKLPDSMASA
jgi:CBS domain containing-hemolysin-like protein